MVGKRGKGEGITWKKRDGLERAGGEKSEGIIVGNRGKGKREGIRLEGWGKEGRDNGTEVWVGKKSKNWGLGPGGEEG